VITQGTAKKAKLEGVEAFGKTDVGRRRKLNEDSFLVDPETHLYAVCDGMGGHNAGEVASRMAIEALDAFVQKSHREKEITWPYGLDADLSFAGNRLKTAIKLANRKVFRAADNREDYTGMGTTVVAALVTEADRLLTVGSAGDSRCYLYAGGALRQLTTDHTFLADMERSGGIGRDEFDLHPLAAAEAGAAKPGTLRQNLVDHRMLAGGRQVKVDEARAGHFHLQQQLTGWQRCHDAAGQLAGVLPCRLGELHGDVAGIVAKLAVAGPLQLRVEGQFGRQPNTRLRASPSNTQPCASIA